MHLKIRSFACGFCVLLCVNQARMLVSCLNVSDANLLYTQLLTNYNRKLLPLLNQSEAVEVGISVYIVSINKFDELSGEFSFTALLNLTWREERMSWQPEKFGGKTSFLISPEDIWRPKTFVRQSFDILQEIGNQSDMLRITSSGFVVWTLGTVIKVTCSVDVTFFPFDSQTCTVSLTTLAVRSDEVKLYSLSERADTVYWEGNSQWSFENNSVSSFTYPHGPSGIRINITLKRRCEFYVIYILIPLICLGKINNLVFFIPANSGERSSVAITAFLSFAVYMQIVNNCVPQSSAPIAYIYFYLMFLLIYSSYIMFACIVSMRIYDKKGKVPVFIKTVVLFLRCSCCKSRKTNTKIDAVENYESEQEKSEASGKKQKKQSEDMEVTWVVVGKTFDIYCSMFNFFFFVTFTLWMVLCLYFNAEFLK